MSPEIGIQLDEHGRADLVCRPLPGEDRTLSRELAMQISLAGFDLEDFVKRKGSKYHRYYENAINILSKYMPGGPARELAQAYIDRNEGVKAVIKSDSHGLKFKGLIKK